MANPMDSSVKAGWKSEALEEASEVEFLRWVYWNIDDEDRARLTAQFMRDREKAAPPVQL